MTKHCQLLSNSQRQKTITCYQLKKQTNQSVKPITIKPCIAKPHNKRLRAKSSVGKTPETLAILLQITVANLHFCANSSNITAFLHKKYSPVTSCVTKSVTSCHRAVTLCHALVTHCHTLSPMCPRGHVPICPVACNAKCNAMCNGHVTLLVTKTLRIVFSSTHFSVMHFCFFYKCVQ